MTNRQEMSDRLCARCKQPFWHVGTYWFEQSDPRLQGKVRALCADCQNDGWAFSERGIPVRPIAERKKREERP